MEKNFIIWKKIKNMKNKNKLNYNSENERMRSK